MADYLSNLIGKWALNEGTGTTVVDSIGGSNGTLTNGPTWSVDSYSKPVVLFDGVNDYINIGDVSNAEIHGDFSYFAMVNASALPGASQRMWIATKGGNGGTFAYEWELSAYGYVSPPKYRAYLYQSSSSAYMQASSATTCTTNTDMGIGFTYVASTHTLTMYVNGLPDGSSTATTGSINSVFDAGFQMGRRGDGAEKTWKGTQRDHWAYSRALTNADVAALYAFLTSPATKSRAFIPDAFTMGY